MFVSARATVIALIAYLLGCFQFVTAQDQIPISKLQGLDNTEYLKFQSKPNNKDVQHYHVFIKLPVEYTNTEATQYPILYLLDGGTNFPLIAGYYDYLRWMGDIPPMIIAGLSYGTHDWKEGNNRSHDFTAKSKEKEHYGGAEKFDEFLAKTLLPEIAKHYSIDTNKQILFGQSLGGQFALYTAMYGTAPFFAVIASNPAIHRNTDYYKQSPIPRKNRPKIFITSAEFDNPRFKNPFTEWHEYWQKQEKDWHYELKALPNHNHLSATPESIRQGLKSLLSEQE